MKLSINHEPNSAVPEVNAAAFERWIGIADVHRDNYRIFCVLAGVLNPAFGLVYQLTGVDVIDPLWARFALGATSLLLLSLSYMSAWVKEHFVKLVHIFFYGLIAFYVGMTALNGFAPDYTMGMMFVITAVGIVFGLGLTHISPLVRYLGFSVMLVIPALYFVESPQINQAIVAICIVSISTVIYVAARAKIRAEESMRASEMRYRMLMNGANDAIFIIDPEAEEIVDANYKAQQFIGRTLEEIQEMHPADLYPAEKREESLSLLYKHAFEGASFAADFHMVASDGIRTPVDVSASLIDIGGRRLVQGIFRNATERYQYEKELIQAKDRAEEMLHLKTSFLNNMSHEIRTPLTSILGYAEVLSAEVAEAQQEFVFTIRESAKRLHQTLNSVLDLAQLESGKANVSLQTLEVTREAEDIVSVLQPLADQKKLVLRYVKKAANVHADLDRGCMNRILNNLVGNAIKFTQEGYVSVEVDADASNVIVRVRDTGIGISEEFQRHLFNEFRQESTGFSRSYEGNGLGLAITKRLVELMGGSIQVESIKDLGSTFTVNFPRVYPAKAHSNGEARMLVQPSNQSEQKRRVLIVEDNQATRHLVKHCLGKQYHVEMAATPEEAVRIAKDGSFDVFLLDINLASQRDGVDVLFDIRALEGYENIPAVALTAYSMPGDREYFLGVGFNCYLSKPFTLQELLDTVERASCSASEGPLSMFASGLATQASTPEPILESNWQA